MTSCTEKVRPLRRTGGPHGVHGVRLGQDLLGGGALRPHRSPGAPRLDGFESADPRSARRYTASNLQTGRPANNNTKSNLPPANSITRASVKVLAAMGRGSCHKKKGTQGEFKVPILCGL